MDFMRCICGDEVACPHAECMALLTPEQRRQWNKTGQVPHE